VEKVAVRRGGYREAKAKGAGLPRSSAMGSTSNQTNERGMQCARPGKGVCESRGEREAPLGKAPTMP